MKVCVAGASGAIGRALLVRLVGQGHAVTGIVRSGPGAARVREYGAEPIQLDMFNKEAVAAALTRVEPDAVIDQLTALPGDIAKLGEALPGDARLRLEGGGNLLAVAETLGVKRYVQQSSGYYLAADGGLADETAPFRIDAPGGTGSSARMFAALEERLLGAASIEGVALRYGFFYGPGTWYWPDGAVADQVRRGEMPIVGGGTAIYSFVHIDDAADATIAALTAPPGIYNVVDDQPEPVKRWLPAFARWLQAPAPEMVSARDALPFFGEDGVYEQLKLDGATNRKARSELGFDPRKLLWMEP